MYGWIIKKAEKSAAEERKKKSFNGNTLSLNTDSENRKNCISKMKTRVEWRENQDRRCLQMLFPSISIFTIDSRIRNIFFFILFHFYSVDIFTSGMYEKYEFNQKLPQYIDISRSEWFKLKMNHCISHQFRTTLIVLLFIFSSIVTKTFNFSC